MWPTGRIIAAFCLLKFSTAYPYFRDKIPNGHIVANPCNTSEIWFGVGHMQRYGNGELDVFGHDFQKLGMEWTKALCRMDSDGDGFTNGEELGDPNCDWIPGGSPLCLHNSTGHACVKPGFDLKCDGFQCAAKAGTKELEIMFSETDVPQQSKTYKCQAFALPIDKDYHLAAVTPNISNINHVHHMTLLGCRRQIESRHTDAPHECTMGDRASCSDPLLVWTIGDLGVCFSNKQAAWRLGKTGYKYVMIETLYYNENLESGVFDASGLTLHYTESLRPNDLGAFYVGQVSLVYIPPGKRSFEVSGVCKGYCIGGELMEEEITIIGGQTQMRHRGKSGKIYIGRTDKTTDVIVEDDDYHYDDPKIHMFETPKTLEYGESLGVNCTYDTTGEYKTVLFGNDVNVNEMCSGYIYYYPKDGLNGYACVVVNNIDSCEMRKNTIAGCEWRNLYNESHPDTMKAMNNVATKCVAGKCLPECQSVAEYYSKHPCYSGELRDYQLLYAMPSMQDVEMNARQLDFWLRLLSCDSCKENGTSAAMFHHGSGFILLVLACFVFLLLNMQ
ncbi:MOXD1 homolog 1-like [Mya arenaria]|uniref:MOXD1 homolog 1-like n=1 Tax=Mya arenaria TaxID=6604 RepID=UPI0022E2EC8E|nr:MOXD1 homolog 1-like [Mya arenaria]